MANDCLDSTYFMFFLNTKCFFLMMPITFFITNTLYSPAGNCAESERSGRKHLADAAHRPPSKSHRCAPHLCQHDRAFDFDLRIAHIDQFVGQRRFVRGCQSFDKVRANGDALWPVQYPARGRFPCNWHRPKISGQFLTPAARGAPPSGPGASRAATMFPPSAVALTGVGPRPVQVLKPVG